MLTLLETDFAEDHIHIEMKAQFGVAEAAFGAAKMPDLKGGAADWHRHRTLLTAQSNGLESGSFRARKTRRDARACAVPGQRVDPARRALIARRWYTNALNS
jgi:hypothetical protein